MWGTFREPDAFPGGPAPYLRPVVATVKGVVARVVEAEVVRQLAPHHGLLDEGVGAVGEREEGERRERGGREEGESGGRERREREGVKEMKRH